LERVAARVSRGTLIRVGTEEWRQAFPEIGFKRDHLFLLPVSIRDEWLDGAQPVRATGPTILWLGKLRRYKCPDQLISALPEVVAKIPDARLVLAIRRDDMAYEQELRALVSKLGLASYVEYRLNVTEDEKRELMRAASVLVVTSAVEGFGIVTLEANACGVPVVASSGVPEGAVRDEFNGLRYPFGDTHALASALVRVLGDEELHSRLGQNALTNVQRFRWSRVGAQFEQIALNAASRQMPADVSKD
jgi:glycosyltransferase involved in cell wall biosynthesis